MISEVRFRSGIITTFRTVFTYLIMRLGIVIIIFFNVNWFLVTAIKPDWRNIDVIIDAANMIIGVIFCHYFVITFITVAISNAMRHDNMFIDVGNGNMLVFTNTTFLTNDIV